MKFFFFFFFHLTFHSVMSDSSPVNSVVYNQDLFSVVIFIVASSWAEQHAASLVKY